MELLKAFGPVSNAALLNFEPIAALILGYLILGQSVAPLQIEEMYLAGAEPVAAKTE